MKRLKLRISTHVCFRCYFRTASKVAERFERRIIEEISKMFNGSDSFYFSLTGDITNSLQRQASYKVDPRSGPLLECLVWVSYGGGLVIIVGSRKKDSGFNASCPQIRLHRLVGGSSGPRYSLLCFDFQ